MATTLSRPRRILPGFGLSLGFTVTALSLIVLLPLAAAVLKSSTLGWSDFWAAITSKRALAAFQVSVSTSLYAAIFDVIAGTLIAWVLVRYPFPGRRFFDAIVDLPFALPTAVAGIALTQLYDRKGWLGQYLNQIHFDAWDFMGMHFEAWDMKTTNSALGISIALAFIGLPFVVRSLQPILEDLEPEFEEAAASLGASRWTIIRRVIFPAIVPAMLTGFTLAFARGLGEYGSVVFISGNLPGKTEILPLLIVTQLEQYHYQEATALAVAMLGISFSFLLLINLLQRWQQKSKGH